MYRTVNIALTTVTVMKYPVVTETKTYRIAQYLDVDSNMFAFFEAVTVSEPHYVLNSKTDRYTHTHI